MWKIHSRLSGTGKLQGNEQIEQYTQVGMIALDDL